MKLFNILKKQKTRYITKELISLSSLAQVPSLDYFKGNNQVLYLINFRKKEYIEILMKEKVLTSKDLKSDELHNKLKMIYTFIEQNTLGDELFEKVIFAEEDKVKALIKLRKFVIYNEQIKDLEEEIVSRIIALKEILKKTFLNKQKRTSIINEINNLTNIFVILMHQKEALRLCLNNYGLKCFDITKERNLDKEQELIKMRKEELNTYQVQVFGKIVYELNDLNDMAKVEIALEDYVYNYNWEDNSLREEITNFCHDTKKSLDNQAVGFNQLLTKILELENKCKIFYEFGKNIIAMEDLKKLYRLKFKYFTTYRYECDKPVLIEPFINAKTFKLELETYKEIVYDLINKLNNNESTISLFKKAFNNDYLTVIKLLNKELQIDGEYDTLNILKDKYKLNLLIAFLKPIYVQILDVSCKTLNTLIIKNIYKLLYVKKSDYPDINFYEPTLSWNEDLPLETINELKLMQWQMRDLGLYLFLKKFYENNETYSLPEGLIGIGTYYDLPSIFPVEIDHEKLTKNFIEPMRRNMEGKKVILPQSLKLISVDLFGNTKIKELVLNKYFIYCKSNPNTSKIIVPANLTSFDGITLENAQELIFLDCENSFLLHNREHFQDFLQNFLYCQYTGKKVSSPDLAKHNMCYFEPEYLVKSNLKKLVFLINNNYVELPIIIPQKTFHFGTTLEVKTSFVDKLEKKFYLHSYGTIEPQRVDSYVYVANYIYEKIQKEIFHYQDKSIIKNCL